MSNVTIKLVVDVVAALDTGRLDGNLFAFDTHRRVGSRNIGTDALQTAVTRGTEIIWMIAPLECETFAAMEQIRIDPAVCEPQKQAFPGTSVSYWTGTVKKASAATCYDIVLELGSHGRTMAHTAKLGLVPASRKLEKGDH